MLIYLRQAYFHIDDIHDKFLIATGVEGNKFKTPYIQLWQAEDICMYCISCSNDRLVLSYTYRCKGKYIPTCERENNFDNQCV